MTKKIVFDCDGVLRNFTKGYAKVLRKLGIAIPENYQPRAWHWPETTPEIEADAFKMISQIENFWLHLDPLTGCLALRDFIHDPASADTEIYLATSCSPSAGKTVAHQTREFAEHWIGWSPNLNVVTIPDSRRKPEFFLAIGAQFSIEDYDETVRNTQRFAKMRGFDHRAFLLDQSWNRHANDLNHSRVKDVDEFLKIVKGETKWK